MNMKKFLATGMSAALLTMSAAASAKVYPFQGPLYESATGSYTTAMRVSGYIETSAPLPNSSPVADITGQIIAYSFNDGVVTLDQNNSQLCSFTLGTDSAGTPFGGFTTINGLPGGIGSNGMDLSVGANPDPMSLTVTQAGTFFLPNALCTTNAYDSNNFASANAVMAYIGAVASQQLPVLTPWWLVLLGAGILAAGVVTSRRKRI
jgi:opacity protein-like surface antigen